MNDNAAQAAIHLIVSFERLRKSVTDCDNLRRAPAKKTASWELAEQACMDAESFYMDWIIKQTHMIGTICLARARHIEWISERIKKESDTGKAKP